MAKRFSKEIVIASIQKIRKRGGKLNSGYVQIHRRNLYQAAYTWHGGWKQAVEAAGISYDSVRADPNWRLKQRVWSKKKVVAAIRKMRRSGEPINSNYAQTHRQAIYGAAVKNFGGWRQAVEAAGFDYGSVRRGRPFRSWSKAAVAEAIHERYRQGLSINYVVVDREDPGLRSAAIRYFGKRGWSRALRYAGFNPRTLPDPRRVWTKERVKAEILARHIQDLPLNTASMTGKLWNLVSAACKLYGSWRKAIRSAGLNYAEIRRGKKNWWTPKRVVAQIRQLERAGVRLSLKSIRVSRGGLIGAAIQHYGSWSQAVDAAGIDYTQHLRIWSTKAWVRKLRSTDVAKIKRRVSKLAK